MLMLTENANVIVCKNAPMQLFETLFLCKEFFFYILSIPNIIIIRNYLKVIKNAT